MPEEKFKPIAPKDLKGDQKAIVQETDYQWREGPVVLDFHPTWKEQIAWYEGQQYSFWNRISNQLEDLSPFVKRQKKSVYNRIMPMVRQLNGEIQYPAEYFVEPNSLEADDIRASKIASLIVEHTNKVGHFRKKCNRAKLWSIIVGNVFWKEWWDTSLETRAKKGTTEATITGDINFDYVVPFNIRPDDLSKSREQCRWFIEGKRVPKSSVEREFKLKEGSLPDENREGGDDKLFDRPERQTPKEGTVIRIERWWKPYPGFDKGRFIVIAGGWLLWDSASPAPGAQIPYFFPPGLFPFMNDFFYDSPVRIAMPAQRAFNRYMSKLDEHFENLSLKALIPRGSMIAGDLKRYQRAGVEYVEYDSAFGTPYWQNPPGVPEGLFSVISLVLSEFKEETSVRDVSLAGLPKYSSRASGVLFQGLKTQDEAVLVPFFEDTKEEFEAALKFRLQLVQKHYNIPRLVKTTGKSKEISAQFVSNTDLRDNTDVRVKAGVEIFTQRDKRREVVTKLIDKGYISNVRQALELLDIKGLDEYMEEEFVDERQAHRIVDLIREGKEPAETSSDDNHEVLYRILNTARKKEDFETWPEKAKKELLARIEQHKKYLGMDQPEEKGAETPPVETPPTEALPPEATAIPPELAQMLGRGE